MDKSILLFIKKRHGSAGVPGYAGVSPALKCPEGAEQSHAGRYGIMNGHEKDEISGL